MEAVAEKESSALGGLFQSLIGDMKSSCPVWEDFLSKAGKLQSQLRATAGATAAFLEAFQRVADLASSSRGGTREIGSGLTRMCLRLRGIEAKLKHFSWVFLDSLINPLQEQIEEWKRGVASLDKDHAKEYKRSRLEIKRKSTDALKLQKKAKKGHGGVQPQLDFALQDVSEKYFLLEETEKHAVRRALLEERRRFCCFVAMLRPLVDEEMALLGEVTHLQTISDDLKALTSDPQNLPPASEQVILDLKGSDCHWSFQTPPSSPGATVSRKSSMCSVHSCDSRGSGSGSHSHSPSSSSSSSSTTSSSHLLHPLLLHHRYRSSTLPLQAPPRLSSISSHDSGFTSSSHEQNTPSPRPPDAKLTNGFDPHPPAAEPPFLGGLGTAAAFPFLPPSSSSRSWARPSSALLPDLPHYCTLSSTMLPSSRVPSWKDWAKPGPYDQPVVNTLRRRKERDHAPTPLAATHPSGPTVGVAPVSLGEELGCPQPGDLGAPGELALDLSRGLQLDTQSSSRDSIQSSSGYSTQNTTPCCSEDTLPSQVSDYDYFSMAGDQEPGDQEPGDQQQSHVDKSSTIPRSSEISRSYHRTFQAKRPASTAGLPSPSVYPAYPSTPTASCSSGQALSPGSSSCSSGHALSPGSSSCSSGHALSPGSSHYAPHIVTPGVATIRRTPSTKPAVRRCGSAPVGPLPVRTPRVPAQIPRGPHLPAARLHGDRSGREEALSGAGGEDGPLFPGSTPDSTWDPCPPTYASLGFLPGGQEEWGGEEEVEEQQGGSMLAAIRRGVKLKKTLTDDRSAPRIA